MIYRIAPLVILLMTGNWFCNSKEEKQDLNVVIELSYKNFAVNSKLYSYIEREFNDKKHSIICGQVTVENISIVDQRFNFKKILLKQNNVISQFPNIDSSIDYIIMEETIRSKSKISKNLCWSFKDYLFKENELKDFTLEVVEVFKYQ